MTTADNNTLIPDKTKRKISSIYFLGFITLGLIASLIGPSLPSFAENTGSTFKQLSNLFILSSVGYIAGSLISGRILNRVRGHWLISISLILLALLIALLPVIRQLWVLVAVFFLLGIFQSMMDVAENTLLIWLHGQNVSSFMNGLHFFFGVGTLVAPLIIAQALRITGVIDMALWVIATFLLLPAALILKYPSPREPSIAVQTTEKKTDSTSMLIVILIVFVFFGFVGAEITFGNWVYTYSLGMGHTDVQSGAYLTSAFWSTFTLARFAGIFLSRRISVRAMMWFDLIGALISLLAILIFNQSAVLLWVGTICFGLSIATCFPTAMNLAERLGVISPRVTSWFFISASTTGMISPWLVGQYFENPGPIILMWVLLGNAVIALGSFAVLNMIKPAMGVSKSS